MATFGTSSRSSCEDTYANEGKADSSETSSSHNFLLSPPPRHCRRQNSCGLIAYALTLSNFQFFCSSGWTNRLSPPCLGTAAAPRKARPVRTGLSPASAVGRAFGGSPGASPITPYAPQYLNALPQRDHAAGHSLRRRRLISKLRVLQNPARRLPRPSLRAR